ncbi:MAG: DUF1993 domain-containing protein [Sphingomonadaceae bacterium]|nr:DUF1993 domain-containing protein [Sphingomonadaceae bacterium]
MIRLYTATVPAFLQQIAAVAGLLDRAEAFAAERGIAAETLLGARFVPDMNDFRYQVKSVAVHSWGAIEGVRAGFFAPDTTPPPADLPALRARLADTRAALEGLDPGEVDGFMGRDMVFGMGERRAAYAAEDFLLSFTLPNLYFHAATAYDLLRWQGVPLAKHHYLGRPRFRPG